MGKTKTKLPFIKKSLETISHKVGGEKKKQHQINGSKMIKQKIESRLLSLGPPTAIFTKERNFYLV
jgi:hypothetical protein